MVSHLLLCISHGLYCGPTVSRPVVPPLGGIAVDTHTHTCTSTRTHRQIQVRREAGRLREGIAVLGLPWSGAGSDNAEERDHIFIGTQTCVAPNTPFDRVRVYDKVLTFDFVPALHLLPPSTLLPEMEHPPSLHPATGVTRQGVDLTSYDPVPNPHLFRQRSDSLKASRNVTSLSQSCHYLYLSLVNKLLLLPLPPPG